MRLSQCAVAVVLICSLRAEPETPPRRSVCTELAAKLAAGLPKFVPKPPAVETGGPDQPAAKLNDIPQNGIIRLPRYEVQEQRLPYHSERDLLTPKGRLDLALKRHPGFNFGPFKFLNHRRALEWLAEEQQAERNTEMADLFGKQRSYEQLRAAEKPTSAPTK